MRRGFTSAQPIRSRLRPFGFTLVLAVFVGWHPAVLTAQQQERISEFGKYEGYTESRFDEWVTHSRYLEMRDGVRLAIDVVRPAVDGKATAEPLPVIWTHSRYHRSPQAALKQFGAGNADRIKSMVDASSDLKRLVRHGYVLAAAAVRGSGASFGRYEGLFSPSETRDAYEITQWLASQPWCDGNVGMHGGSYLGITQYMAASQAPPALKAIFPNVAGFDLYDVIYPGGVYRLDMVKHWGDLTRQLDTQWLPQRVESDAKGQQLKLAVAEHLDNWDVIKEFRVAKFRDTVASGYSYLTHNPAPYLAQINQAQVPAYHWCGWDDIFITDALLWYTNYRGPQKLAVGAWPHSQTLDRELMRERSRLLSAEQHRWFDYWLKGIDNGVMDDHPVRFATLDDPGRWQWQTATTWPLSATRSAQFYFAAGFSGSVKSVNDGQLTESKPQMAEARDDYPVNPNTTTGTATRWDNAVGAGVLNYPDMTSNDEQSLTYTTAPLSEDLPVTGHPVVTLFVQSTSDDADFYVLLEEVDANGKSRYVTEGILRASHRQLADAPWNNVGLPYQRSFERDKSKLPIGQVTKLQFDLHPVSQIFNAGHRIRIAVMGADKDNTEPPPAPDATISIHRSKPYPSHIQLPIRSSD